MRAVVEPDQATTTLEGTPAALAIAASRRIGWFEAGLRIEGAVGATAEHLLTGAEMGAVVPIGTNAQLELLGQAGLHVFHREGCDWICLFSHSDSASASLPYVGARAAVGWILRPQVRLTAGAFAHLDLGHAELAQAVTSCLLGCTTAVDHYRVGGWEAGPDLSLAIEF